MKSSTKTQKWRWLVLGVVALALVALPIMYLATRPQTEGPTGKVNVVTSADFYGDIAKQIGGKRVTISTVLDDPAADPHLYESNTQDAAVLTKANLVILNGLGYDDFMSKLLNASPKADRRTVTVAEVLNVGDDANPHLWYNPASMKTLAQKIADELEALDPAGADEYRRNLDAFENSLKPLEDTVRDIKGRHSQAAVADTERVAAYLLEAGGLRSLSPEGFVQAIEEGEEPSPADAQAMEALISNRTIRVLVYNLQAESPVTERLRRLAEQAGVPVVGVTETLPSGQSFTGWQTNQAKALLKALER
jgi:zinc/manganese transport system substrate-binding protein